MWDRAEKGMCPLLSWKTELRFQAPLLLVGRLFLLQMGVTCPAEEAQGPRRLGVPSGIKDLLCSVSRSWAP